MLKAIFHELPTSVSDAFSSNGSQRSSKDVERECEAYSEHITNLLTEHTDKLTPRYLPFRTDCAPSQALLESLRDGILLAHIINSLKPGAVALNRLNYSVDLQKLNHQHSKATFEVGENLNACVEGARKLRDMGIVVVNIGANDILAMNVDIVLGLVWQLIRAQLLQNVNLVARPELIRLLLPGESLKTLLAMNPELILLRWFNFHLKRAGQPTMFNFSTDLSDSSKYFTLLHNICPPSDALDKMLTLRGAETHSKAGLELRAKAVLQFAETIQCRKFVTVGDIVGGNARLNLAFTAGLFNRYIGIVLPTDEEVRGLYTKIDSLSRECAALKRDLARKDDDAAAKQRDFIAAKEAWDAQIAAVEERFMAEIEHLKLSQSTEADKNRIKMEVTVEKKDLEVAAMKVSMEQQLRDQEDRLIAKHQRDLNNAEYRYQKQESAMTKELDNLKKSFASFFDANHIEPPQLLQQPALSGPAKAHQVRECVIKLIESFYEKIDETAAMGKKLGHLEHVNNVIGDKIQEYAESVIQEKRRDKKGALGSLFSK